MLFYCRLCAHLNLLLNALSMLSSRVLKEPRGCFMQNVSSPKMQEFCSTVGYSKDQQYQEEFNRTILSSAREAVDSSLMGAPFSRLWGTAVGCLLGAPTKWGKFASTLALTSDRVNDSLQLTFAGMNAGKYRNPSSSVYVPLNKMISRIQPAIAADIVNEGLPEDSKISERAYQKYFVASSVAGVFAALGPLLVVAAAAAAFSNRK